MTGKDSSITTNMIMSTTPIEDTMAPDFARIIVDIALPPRRLLKTIWYSFVCPLVTFSIVGQD